VLGQGYQAYQFWLELVKYINLNTVVTGPHLSKKMFLRSAKASDEAIIQNSGSHECVLVKI